MNDLIKRQFKIFRNNDESKIQMDVARGDGSILLQIFKSYDVKNWTNLKVADKKEEGFYVVIFFSNSKFDNKNNLKRFKSSKLSSKFTKFGKKFIAYYLHFPENIETTDMVLFLRELIGEIYIINNETITLTVNSY